MRVSVKHKIIGLALGLLASVVAVTGSVAYYSMNQVIMKAMLAKGAADLNMAQDVFDRTYAGPWSVRPDGLYKGANRISDNNDLVDHIGRLTGGTATVPPTTRRSRKSDSPGTGTKSSTARCSRSAADWNACVTTPNTTTRP